MWLRRERGNLGDGERESGREGREKLWVRRERENVIEKRERKWG